LTPIQISRYAYADVLEQRVFYNYTT